MKPAALILALFCLALSARADSVIDALKYSDNSAATKIWKPMTGSAPAQAGQVGGRPALLLPCNFAGTKFDRASWDRSGDFDMSRCAALSFDVYCEDTAPISGFTCYLQSGKGWYIARFAPTAKKWTTVTIRKEDTSIEGQPAGWSKINTVRISAWRGRDQDTQLGLSNLRLVGDRPGGVLIVRNESGVMKNQEEAKSIAQFTDGVALHLNDLGVSYSLISDLDLALLKDSAASAARVIILPYDPRLSPEAEAALLKCIQSTSPTAPRIIAFYSLSSKLLQAAGIKSGKHLAAKGTGQFAQIRAADRAPRGFPKTVTQNSWNINSAQLTAPADQNHYVAAWWHTKDGQETKEPAILVTPKLTLMTHVLLGEDQPGGRQLLLALAGNYSPSIWHEAAQGALASAGKNLGYDSPDAALADLEPKSRSHDKARLAISQAAAIHASAKSLLGANKDEKVIELAADLQKRLLEAYCLVEPSAAGEFRAFWCHNASGPRGMTWDQSIKALADNGFNAILPNMLWGGVAYYNSSVLPVAPEVAEQGDQIALCLDACKKYGVQCHVWKVNWNLGWRTPKEFIARLKQQNRLQVHFDLSPNDQWLCPSHPDNAKLEVAAMVEVATKYKVDGIHFDYIRYPDNNGCFCDRCRELFEKRIGKKVASWPADTRKALRDPWNDFRRDNITAVVATVSEQARKVHPSIKISAAVFSNWSVDRDTVAQDWKLWCEKGYLDFVCPMDYTPHNSTFDSLVQNQVQWAGKVPVYPGIGLSVWSQKNDVAGVVEKVRIARAAGCKGFTIFEYSPSAAEAVLPMLHLGLTSQR